MKTCRSARQPNSTGSSSTGCSVKKRARHCLAAMFVSGSLLSCATPQPPGDVSSITVASVREGVASDAQAVRWGGTIVDIEHADNLTILQIVSRPLHGGGRPKHNDNSDGRFLAEISGFLDPEIVKTGRDMTVTGTLVASRDGTVGDASYRFPVVKVDLHRYWKPVVASTLPAGHYHPYGHIHHTWQEEFWHDWPHSPHRTNQQRNFVRGQIIF